jgi:hypothetical protein
VRQIKGVLDGENGLRIQLLVRALVDSDDLRRLLLLLPDPRAVVAEESLENLVVADPFKRRDLSAVLLESIVDVELFDLVLLDTFEVEVRTVDTSTPSVQNGVDCFGLDEVVDQHQDHGVGRKGALADEAYFLAPKFD